jgi:small-conductance mechanosensitive channel
LAEKTKTSIDDLLVLRVKKYLIPILYFAAFYFNIKILYLNDFLTKVINMLIFAFITVILTMFVSSAAVFFFNKYLDNKLKGSSSKLTLKWINGITKTLIWGIALILFFDNIGFKINSLITGLGIGGIAIAFAAQSVLTDIFLFYHDFI